MSLYRPGQALIARRISRQSAHEVAMLSALCIGHLYPRRRHPLHSFPLEADSTPEERNSIRENPQKKSIIPYVWWAVSVAGSAGVLPAPLSRILRISVLTICRLWEAGVARCCRLHVPTFLFLDVHVVVWVFNEGSGSRRYLRR